MKAVLVVEVIVQEQIGTALQWLLGLILIGRMTVIILASCSPSAAISACTASTATTASTLCVGRVESRFLI